MSDNLALVLQFMGFAPGDFTITKAGVGVSAVYSTEWLSVSPQPVEEEINTAAASQEFLDWRAENGGDPLRTLRREAKEALSGSRAEHALLRSVLLVIVDELNRHTDKTNAILDAIDGASNLSGLKTAIGAITNLPQRTGEQLRSAAELKLNGGDADS